MRRLTRMGLAILGLALAAPNAFCADPPSPRRSRASGEMAEQPPDSKPMHLCAKCAKKLKEQARQMAAAPMTSPGCTACQMGTTSNTPMMVVQGNEGPGFAVVGGPADMPASVSMDPAPIGVMQTGYSSAAMHAGPGRGVATDMTTAASPAPFVGPQTSKPNYRRQFWLAQLLAAPDVGSPWRAERRARKKAAHAAISYNNPSELPNEVPAEMVFGR